MGPTLPWLPDLYHFGIDYLAGVVVADPAAVRSIVAEGGGIRLFEGGVQYRVAPLNAAAAAAWSKQLIARTASEKDWLTQAMDAWYADGASLRFPQWARLDAAQRILSRLDTCYQRLWEARTHDDRT